MGQMGFFDIANRYAGLDAKNDPLVKIDAVVSWADFRVRLEAAWRKPPEERKSNAGCKPWDAIVMFKAIVLCALYNLSDDQVEYQIRDAKFTNQVHHFMEVARWERFTTSSIWTSVLNWIACEMQAIHFDELER